MQCLLISSRGLVEYPKGRRRERNGSRCRKIYVVALNEKKNNEKRGQRMSRARLRSVIWFRRSVLANVCESFLSAYPLAAYVSREARQQRRGITYDMNFLESSRDKVILWQFALFFIFIR